MKLITDCNIPHVKELFSDFASIVEMPADTINQQTLKDAQILLTRTVTQVTPTLLSNTNIEFVGSATTGIDHIDVAWLNQHNIKLATAAGANADAVVDYVASCLAALKISKKLGKNATIGIIGCGRIGMKIANLSPLLGFNVICNDPFLASNSAPNLVSLDKLLSQADLITLHTPLTKTGQYPTHHLLNENRLKQLKPNCIIINSARGSIIDEKALLKLNITTCIDAWENEPNINQQLLEKSIIGTPHIAGYTQEAKYRATEMIFEAAAKHFNWPINDKHINIPTKKPLKERNRITNWESQILEGFNPITRSLELKEAIKSCSNQNDAAKAFNQQRQRPFRHALKIADLAS